MIESTGGATETSTTGGVTTVSPTGVAAIIGSGKNRLLDNRCRDKNPLLLEIYFFGNHTPLDLLIFQEHSMSRFYKLSALIWTIKIVLF